MENLIKKKINDIDVYYIKSDKFKTITWTMVFTHEPGNNLINEYYFLTNALDDNMKKYPSNVKKYRYQSSLYGLDAYSSITAIGNNIVNTFVITYPNESYIENCDKLSKKAFVFLNELITNPILRKGRFTKKVLNNNIEEANELHQLLKSIKDMYAYYLFSKKLYIDYPDLQFNFPEHDKLISVNLDSLTKAYNNLFDEANIAIFVTGNFNDNEFDKIIKNNLSNKIVNHSVSKEKRIFSYNKDLLPKYIRYKDKSVKQARIFLGYNTDIEYLSDKHPIMSVLDNILGGFDQSKLFMQIREERNLAYYVDSSYIPDENLLIVSVSTSFENQNLVIEMIKNVVNEMKEGNISDELFNRAKSNCIHSLKTIVDSQFSYLMQHIKSLHLNNEKYDLKKRLSQYNSVTKQDVIEACNSLILNTIFVYSKEGDTDE